MINILEFTAAIITKRTRAGKAQSQLAALLIEACCDAFTPAHQVVGRLLRPHSRRIRGTSDWVLICHSRESGNPCSSRRNGSPLEPALECFDRGRGRHLFGGSLEVDAFAGTTVIQR